MIAEEPDRPHGHPSLTVDQASLDAIRRAEAYVGMAAPQFKAGPDCTYETYFHVGGALRPIVSTTSFSASIST